MLVRLSNAPRPFDWGSEHLIADLEGRPASGPEAEVWFGDHPADPADVEDGSGRTLDAWIRDETGGARLPYLLKILAARQSLSIQAHPTKRQAEEGWAAERELPEAAPHNYADDNHKPEMIVSLCDEFVALCGLRDIERTRELLAELGDAASPLLERIRDDASLADAIAWLLSGDAQETVDAISLALADARSDAFAADFDNARRNAADFPGDPGVVVGLLMNLMTLGYGEALFLRAGQLHAYQSGIGVEIMAASDNVMRGGLTPKHIDVAELMRVLERKSGPVALVRPVSAGSGFDEYPVEIDDFRLLRATLGDGGSAAADLDGTAIVLSVSGTASVTAGSGSIDIMPGRAAFVTEESALEITGSGEVFVALSGV
ncbi:MAG: mannose-6-phosphate isomerase, class I [Microbacterium gubbeenense]|uniref:mannose-6-phosphate isomerase, class I n=1 Tax=Microbacterium gubbeenense TaxID=159896 RepID=UPI003F94D757